MSKAIPFILAVFLTSGCSDDTEVTPKQDAKVTPADTFVTTADKAVTPQVDGEVTTEAASAVFSGLKAGVELKGEVSIKMEIKGTPTKVELIANKTVVGTVTAAPFEIKWDTTGFTDGIAQLSLKAYDAKGDKTSEELLALVVNNGQVVEFDDGNGSDTMKIESLVADNDKKYHWTMPTGVKKVISIATWDNTAWTLQVALGTGVCPHNGTPAGNATSETSPVAYEFAATTGTIPSGTTWYVHMGCMNEEKVLGTETKITYKVFLVK